jgi:hypothetical protein
MKCTSKLLVLVIRESARKNLRLVLSEPAATSQMGLSSYFRAGWYAMRFSDLVVLTCCGRNDTSTAPASWLCSQGNPRHEGSLTVRATVNRTFLTTALIRQALAHGGITLT